MRCNMFKSRKMIRSSKQESIDSLFACVRKFINSVIYYDHSENNLNVELVSMGTAKYNVQLRYDNGIIEHTCISRKRVNGNKRSNYYQKIGTYYLEDVKKMSEKQIYSLSNKIIKNTFNFAFKDFGMDSHNLKLIKTKPKISTD